MVITTVKLCLLFVYLWEATFQCKTWKKYSPKFHRW